MFSYHTKKIFAFAPSDKFGWMVAIGSRKLCTRLSYKSLWKLYFLSDFLIVCTRHKWEACRQKRTGRKGQMVWKFAKKKKKNNLNIWCRLSRVVCTPLEVFSTSKSPVSTQILRGSLSMLWWSLKLLVPKELRNCERRDIKIPQMKQTPPNGRQ